MLSSMQSSPAASRRFSRTSVGLPSARAGLAGRRHAAVVQAVMKNSRTAELRRLLKGPEILLGPCCHDALSARLIERAGFPFAFMSGFCTAGARLGAPDTGLISYAEMLDTGRSIHEATHSIPIIGDGDTGYGNAMNVKRTVKGYAQAGFAGILIEDQLAPKSCGHVRGKRVVGREEAVSRIRAAADARAEGADILIVARTDARQAVSLEEALWRAQAFAEAGADILFIDALESEGEMLEFGRLGGAAAGVPKMANMLEGGGKTPLLPPSRLHAMGFSLVAYPLSLLGVSIRAMQDALEGLKRGRVPPAEALGSFADIQAAVGFPEYYAEEQRYAISAPTSAAAAPSAAATHGSASTQESEPAAPPASWPAQPPPPPPPRVPVVEAEVLEGRPSAAPSAAPPSAASWPLPSDFSVPSSSSSSTSSPSRPQQSYQPAPSSPTYSGAGSSSSSSSGAGSAASDPASDPAYRRSRSLRVRISDRANPGLVKLETRIPAGFLNGLSALVPQVAAFNVEALIQQAMGPGGMLPPPGQPLVNVNSGSDNIQIFLE